MDTKLGHHKHGNYLPIYIRIYDECTCMCVSLLVSIYAYMLCIRVYMYICVYRYLYFRPATAVAQYHWLYTGIITQAPAVCLLMIILLGSSSAIPYHVARYISFVRDAEHNNRFLYVVFFSSNFPSTFYYHYYCYYFCFCFFYLSSTPKHH